MNEAVRTPGRGSQGADALAAVVFAPKLGGQPVTFATGHPAALLQLCHHGTSVSSAICPEDHFYHLDITSGTPRPIPDGGPPTRQGTCHATVDTAMNEPSGAI